MDINDIRSLMAASGLALFLALLVYTWKPSRRLAHEEASRLVFDDEVAPREAPRHE